VLKDRAVSSKGQTQLPKSSVCQPLDNLRGALGCLSSVCVCVVWVYVYFHGFVCPLLAERALCPLGYSGCFC